MAFPRGAAGAHSVTNRSGAPARILIVSTMNFPEVAEHLDTGTWLAVLGPRDGKAFPAGGDIPLMEAVVSAIQAPVHRDGRAEAEHEPDADAAGLMRGRSPSQMTH